jgi:hypothetical protein
VTWEGNKKNPDHIFDDLLVAEAIQWYTGLGLVHEVMPIVLRDAVDGHDRIPLDKFALQEAAMVIGDVGAQGGDIILRRVCGLVVGDTID